MIATWLQRLRVVFLRLNIVSFLLLFARCDAEAIDDWTNTTEASLAPMALQLGGDYQWDSTHAFGKMGLGYFFSDSFSGEFSFAAGKSDVRGNSQNATLLLPSAEVLYNFSSGIQRSEQAEFFLSAGLGALQPVESPRDSSTYLTVPLGGGFRVPLWGNLFGRFDARWLPATDFDTARSGATVSAGVSYLFSPSDNKTERKREYNTANEDRLIPWEAPKDTVAESAKQQSQQLEVIPKLVVFFESGRTQIPQDADKMISDFARYLQNHKLTIAIIEGHSDSDETKKFGKKLSLERARNIRSLILSRSQIAGNRVEAVGMGTVRPIGKEDIAQGKAFNRRVVGTLQLAPKSRKWPQPRNPVIK